MTAAGPPAVDADTASGPTSPVAPAVACLAVDTSGRVTAAHGGAAALLDIECEGLIGTVLWSLLPSELALELIDACARAAAVGPVTVQMRMPPSQAWRELHVLPETGGTALLVLDATAHRQLRHRAEQATARARLLGQVTEQLVAAVVPEQAAARLCQLLVPALADWSVVTVVDDDGPAGTRRALRHAAACHRDPALQQLADRYTRARLHEISDDGVVAAAC